ncbi:hypothetical protein SAMN05518672_102253 [Chitinophaga sp. CF118]|uniref:hypothetical protein n=1 Tax=Chitinophaga sp. CF118 TaxID=1884367 RepID=UPI0008ED5EC6|nr:hypothetical protein [Chitinophaga sp. CF118]SFD51398.1 hypothetical protein SAMN05518672_102253 [Chitinophaga sp. CF118]
MKRITLIIAAGLFASGAIAQRTNIIDSTGNVGIGTLTPSALLNVDPHGTGGIVIGNPSSGSGGYTSVLLGISADKSGYGTLQIVKASGSTYGDLSINNSGGNVGIGNIAPVEKLDVTGNLHVSGRIYSDNDQFNTDGGLELGSPITGAAAFPYIDFHYGTGTPQDYNVRIHNYTDNSLAIFTPSSADALLRVIGNIVAKKLRITQTPWADFVFADDYKLPPLMEVENYIKSNKHLPEIPTTKEVEKDGIDVGEMNKKLLQKVEELTLYLIQQQKINEEQNKRINQLEETIKEGCVL